MNKNDVKQSVNIRDEFHFSEVNGSMNATGPVTPFHEPQKNEIYFLIEKHNWATSWETLF